MRFSSALQATSSEAPPRTDEACGPLETAEPRVDSRQSTVDSFRSSSCGIGLAALGLLLCIGCAGRKVIESVFAAPVDTTFESVEAVLSDPDIGAVIERSDRDAGIIETAWQERASDHAHGLLLAGRYLERTRYRVWVAETEPGWTLVRLAIQTQQRPPGGPRAYRWERLPADREHADALMVRIGKTVRERLDRDAELAPPEKDMP